MGSLRFQYKIAKAKGVAYHYADDKAKEHILKEGLCAPSQLIDTEFFNDIKENYLGRTKDALGAAFNENANIDDEMILKYLDYSRSLFCDHIMGGRNMVFALFGEVPKGISKAHDKFTKMDPIVIDIAKLAKIKGDQVEFYMVDIPLQDPVNTNRRIVATDFPWLNEVDFLSYYDPKRTGGLLFAEVPHVGIWIADGVIPAKCLS